MAGTCAGTIFLAVQVFTVGHGARTLEELIETLAGAGVRLVLDVRRFPGSRRHPDFARMKGLMKAPVVFDGRNVFNPAAMREKGFTWYGVGRP